MYPSICILEWFCYFYSNGIVYLFASSNVRIRRVSFGNYFVLTCASFYVYNIQLIF